MGLPGFFGTVFNALVVFTLLAQGLALRARFGVRSHPLLKEYARFVMSMGLTLLLATISISFNASIVLPWTEAHVPGKAPVFLSDLPAPLIAILVPLMMLQEVFSPLLIAVIVPGLCLSLLDYEGIPVSSRQKAMASLTRIVELSMMGLLALAQAIYTAGSLGKSEAAVRMRDMTISFSLAINITTSVITYGSLFAWTIHAFRTQVFKSNPLINRVSRIVLAFTTAALVLTIFQETARILSLRLPPILEIVSCRGEWEYFRAYWFLCGSWGVAGIAVLFRTGPGDPAPAVPVDDPKAVLPGPARDPATAPLPEADALRGIFLARGLSERESQVAALVVDGCGNKEIASAMDISYSTVKNHVANIFRKLGAGNRFELIRSIRKSA